MIKNMSNIQNLIKKMANLKKKLFPDPISQIVLAPPKRRTKFNE